MNLPKIPVSILGSWKMYVRHPEENGPTFLGKFDADTEGRALKRAAQLATRHLGLAEKVSEKRVFVVRS